MSVRLTLTTANTPGAVAIVQLHGEGAQAVLSKLTSRADWPTATAQLARFAEIDSGLAVRLWEDWAQLMPHGGPRVVRRLIERLIALGCAYDAEPTPGELYPEATSALEADMLAMIAHAASPLAIDLLLNQPVNWRRMLSASFPDVPRRQEMLRRSEVLNRLIDLPSVVVVGKPNVGKSTLTNRLLGRTASIVADLPGTTRDWVAGVARLEGGAAVRWMDTPGLRSSEDEVEQRAIAMAAQVISAADVLIVMRDPEIDWPEEASLPRTPDVWVMNKIDTMSRKAQAAADGGSASAPLWISAEHGVGLDGLQSNIVARLGLQAVEMDEAWTFSDALRTMVERGDESSVRRYCGT